LDIASTDSWKPVRLVSGVGRNHKKTTIAYNMSPDPGSPTPGVVVAVVVVVV
jgi:hypothetical protein